MLNPQKIPIFLFILETKQTWSACLSKWSVLSITPSEASTNRTIPSLNLNEADTYRNKVH